MVQGNDGDDEGHQNFWLSENYSKIDMIQKKSDCLVW